jgi:arylsulfatase A
MKRYPYEGGHRIPGIIRWPGHCQPNSVSSQIVNGTDILPTFCNIAGVNVPYDRTIDGEDITSVFHGKSVERTKPLCWFFPAHEDTYYRMPHMIFRENEYTLLAWFNKKSKDELIMDWIKNARLEKFELYNLQIDAGQTNDLRQKEPKRFNKMKTDMVNLWNNIRVEGPYWNKWKMK